MARQWPQRSLNYPNTVKIPQKTVANLIVEYNRELLIASICVPSALFSFKAGQEIILVSRKIKSPDQSVVKVSPHGFCLAIDPRASSEGCRFLNAAATSYPSIREVLGSYYLAQPSLDSNASEVSPCTGEKYPPGWKASRAPTPPSPPLPAFRKERKSLTLVAKWQLPQRARLLLALHDAGVFTLVLSCF